MNTRFNPTTNGPLHIGHIYMVLLNEGMAHDSGGKFHVRFDDDTPHMMRHYIRQIPGRSWSSPEKARLQLDELAWMGIRIDSVTYESELEEGVNKFLAASDFRWGSGTVGYGYSSRPVIVARLGAGDFPMVVRHTVGKVVHDYREGSDVLIRGLEWIVEHQLYMYFCALFGFRFPLCYYVSRLITAGDIGGSSRDDLVDISKTIGNWSVSELRKVGVSPAQVRLELRESCLVDPRGPWSIDNLKDQPRLISKEVKDVLRR